MNLRLSYSFKRTPLVLAAVAFLLSFSALSDSLSGAKKAERFASESDPLAYVEGKFKRSILKINQSLKVSQRRFEQSPIELAKFVDAELLPLWASHKTLSALVGLKSWRQMPISSRQALQTSFNNTLQRYVQEGFDHYDGQTIEFVGVRLNKRQNRGYLTIKVVPNLLPSFNIDLRIGLFEDDHNEADWYLYDAMVQGVSYVTLKKDDYRHRLQEGVGALITSIDQKNQGYLPSHHTLETH